MKKKIEDKQKTITLDLGGDRIASDKLRKSLEAFYGFVDEVASEVSNTRKPIRWIVSVKKGSIVLVNTPEYIEPLSPIITEKIFNSIDEGVTALEKKAERPAYFSDRALERLQDLASLVYARGNGLERIRIKVDNDKHILTQHVVANVESILGVYSRALGSIEGRLETISERGRRRMVVYDSLTDKAIQCDITEDLMPEAIKAFGKRVNVFGMISYDENGTTKRIRVEEIILLDEQEKSISLLSLCGAMGE